MPRFLSRLLAVTLTMTCVGFSACDDPCAELEVRVCEPKTESLKRQYAQQCKLVQEPARRENLPPESCESIIKHLNRLER